MQRKATGVGTPITAGRAPHTAAAAQDPEVPILPTASSAQRGRRSAVSHRTTDAERAKPAAAPPPSAAPDAPAAAPPRGQRPLPAAPPPAGGTGSARGPPPPSAKATQSTRRAPSRWGGPAARLQCRVPPGRRDPNCGHTANRRDRGTPRAAEAGPLHQDRRWYTAPAATLPGHPSPAPRAHCPTGTHTRSEQQCWTPRCARETAAELSRKAASNLPPWK